MKRVGIVTLNGESNYGNRLQNYALQYALRQLGRNSETIVVKSMKTKVLVNVKKVLVSIAPLSGRRFGYWRMLEKKSNIFRPFSKKYLKSRTVSPRHIASIAGGYDLLITGSDQVWNPNFAGRDVHFLTFAPKEKRTSYAASFGVSEIPEDKRKRYTDRLNDMKHISVREEAGLDIVKEMTGRDAALVPDPTMLLSREDWDNLITDYGYLENEKYVVVYTLHDLSSDIRSQVESYAEESSLEIYQIMGDFYDKNHKKPDPVEFVARIKYAKAVFTDSFHASVFSIVMHTPFVAFSRKDARMSSRLVTLLNTYNMSQALYTDKSKLEDIINSETFDKIDEILRIKSTIGEAYLKDVIEGSV